VRTSSVQEPKPGGAEKSTARENSTENYGERSREIQCGPPRSSLRQGKHERSKKTTRHRARFASGQKNYESYPCLCLPNRNLEPEMEKGTRRETEIWTGGTFSRAGNTEQGKTDLGGVSLRRAPHRPRTTDSKHQCRTKTKTTQRPDAET
jgi:hypothetical protein